MSAAMRVRLALPEDIAVLGRFLPAGLEHPLQSHYALAEDSAGNLQGAVCVIFRDGSPRFLIRLNAGCPEREGFEMLVRGAVALVRMEQQHTLRLTGFIPETSLFADVLQKLGFRKVGRLISYEMDITRRRSVALSERIRDRSSLPESIRVCSVKDVAAFPLVRFLQEFFGLKALPRALAPDCSFVLLDGPQILGGLLAVQDGQSIQVPYFAVDETLRDRYATPLLMGAFTEAALVAGHTSVEFMTDETSFPGFARIAKRMGALEKDQLGSYEVLLRSEMASSQCSRSVCIKPEVY